SASSRSGTRRKASIDSWSSAWLRRPRRSACSEKRPSRSLHSTTSSHRGSPSSPPSCRRSRERPARFPARASWSIGELGRTRERERSEMNDQPVVHRFPVQQEGAFVNAYLVEAAAGVVAVDSLLTVSESRAMRRALEQIGKPLQAVLLTQSHPDHYAGLTQLVAEDDVPIFTPQGVIDTIIRDDAVKDAIVGPMFGDEWPGTRIFPNTPVLDGERVTFDGGEFTVIDLGPSESPHDSPWVLGADATTVFLGDQIYDRRHSYLADGFHREWLDNLEQLRARFPDDVVFHIGHGGPVGPADFDWQRD